LCELGTTHLNTNENPTPAPKRKHYDEAFQRSTVEHWLLSGKSARQTAAELGIATQTLQNWQKKFKALAGQWARRWRRPCHWPPWRWPCNIVGRRRDWSIIPTAACNTPVKVTGSGWPPRQLLRQCHDGKLLEQP
jgi:hypothetical protein